MYLALKNVFDSEEMKFALAIFEDDVTVCTPCQHLLSYKLGGQIIILEE